MLGKRHSCEAHLEIGIIGYGAIARYVAENLSGDPRFQISHVFVRPGREAAAASALGDCVQAVDGIHDLDRMPRVVVDCAGHEGLRQFGTDVLSRGADLITVSNGALADAGLAVELFDAARHAGSQLRLLPGAIGAIDAVSAAKIGGLDAVTYTGRKPPAAWRGSPAESVADLSKLTEPLAHFDGPAREAAALYPMNANVAATVALAGLGLDQTKVRLIADPTISANLHQVEAKGAFGKLSMTIETNTLPQSTRSSALAAMSIVRALHNYVDPFAF